MAERVLLTGLACSGLLPYNSPAEVATFTDLFARFLDAEREALVRTGLPRTHFETWPFLDHLSPLYPLSRPRWIRTPSLVGVDGGPWVAQVHLRLRTLRGCCPEEHRGCQCKDADLRDYLTPEAIRRIEDGRERLLNLKLAILGRLQEAAKKQSADGLWDRCLNLLTESLLADDVEFWLRIDEACTGRDLRQGILTPGPLSTTLGGLSALLRLIGWFEVNRTLGLAPAVRKIRDCLPRGGRPASYFDLANRPERGKLDRALDRCGSLVAREREFWAGFWIRVNDALSGAFKVKFEILVPRSVAEQFQAADALAALLSAFANFGVLPTPLNASPGAASPHPRAGRSRNMATFPSPQGLRWEDVTICFISNHSIRIEARGVSKTYSFAEIGFKDGRKAETPDQKWYLLKRLALCSSELYRKKYAERHGEAHWGGDLASTKLRTAVKELRRRLRNLFKIEDDPFHPHHKNDRYQARFTVLIEDQVVEANFASREDDDSEDT